MQRRLRRGEARHPRAAMPADSTYASAMLPRLRDSTAYLRRCRTLTRHDDSAAAHLRRERDMLDIALRAMLMIHRDALRAARDAALCHRYCPDAATPPCLIFSRPPTFFERYEDAASQFARRFRHRSFSFRDAVTMLIFSKTPECRLLPRQARYDADGAMSLMRTTRAA